MTTHCHFNSVVFPRHRSNIHGLEPTANRTPLPFLNSFITGIMKVTMFTSVHKSMVLPGMAHKIL